MCDSYTNEDLLTPMERGNLYPDNKDALKKIVQNFQNLVRQEAGFAKDTIVISDVMSGDARLVGLYCGASKAPLIYLRSLDRLATHDAVGQYLIDVGARVLSIAVPNSQQVYGEFGLPNLRFIKGATLTGKIAKLWGDATAIRHQSEMNGPKFALHVASVLAYEGDFAPYDDICLETTPIAVVWTKGTVAGGNYRGHPEHLLGKMGLRQLSVILRELGFKIAIAGDQQDLANVQHDYDLRYRENGRLQGLSLNQQYGVLKYINERSPLLSISMRSGQVEPLPLIGIRTIYLEETGNNQGERMQKLERALPELYTRNIFALPPTMKGRLRELASFYYNPRLRNATQQNPQLHQQLETLLIALLRTVDLTVPLQYSYAELKLDPARKKVLEKAFEVLKDDPLSAATLKSNFAASAKEAVPRGFDGDEQLKLRGTFSIEFQRLTAKLQETDVLAKKFVLTMAKVDGDGQ